MIVAMEVSIFVREPNSVEYAKAGSSKCSVVPRGDEYISLEWEGDKKYFQVVAIHHASLEDGSIELYAVRSEPPWEIRKSRTIGFGPAAR
jgi:hypothetical protein